MQKVIYLFAVLPLFILVGGNALADRLVREKIGPNIYKSYRVQDPEVKPAVNWRVKTTNTTSGSDTRVRKEILHETVCYDYEPGSIIFRNCRQAAKELFEQKCESLDKKYRETKKPYDKAYRADRDMFCRSAGSFSP